MGIKAVRIAGTGLLRKIWLVPAFAAMLPLSALAGGLLDAVDDFQRIREQGAGSFQLDIDNDSLLFKRDDGFYTSGLRLVRRHALRSAGGLEAAGWRIGQELYTPSDIKLPPSQVGPPDHPYAGLIYAGIFLERYFEDGSMRAFGIDLGCIGPCAGGERTQKALHKILDQPQPQGWSRQIRNEVGLILHGTLRGARFELGRSADIAPFASARFGNIFTDAAAGFLLRAGQLNRLPDEPTLHAFFRLEGRAVGYNATLQGGYFADDDPHTVKPRRFVPEAEAGIVWQAVPFGVEVSIVRRGNEIDALPSSIGRQNFARLRFSYAM